MKVTQMFGVVLVMFLVLLSSALAQDGVNFSDPCYGTPLAVTVSFDPVNGVFENFGISNTCAGGTEVFWTDPVNLSVLGDVTNDEVVITNTFVYVDSVARPDLDHPATIVFRKVPFAAEPDVRRNGLACLDCNVTYDQAGQQVILEVQGFSNYSLTGRQDFTVYSDPEPELRGKVYQTIDLGDANRDEDFSCVVQIYGMNPQSELVLLQTNPERNVQARLFGSPDTNQPESLGYFPTKNGVANVYWNGDLVAGYENFEYVAMCSSNSTKLIFEEPISTRYRAAGRSMVGRGIWLAQDANAFFIIITVVLVFISMFLVVKVFKALFS
jgi:hypothetical protein